MSIRVSCPFDNTSVVLPARPPTGRTVCPRCGETFTIRDAEELDDVAGGGRPPPVSASQQGADAPRPPGPLPSRRAMLISCTLAALILAGGLYFFRPSGGSRNESSDDHSSGTTPPAALAGLRHLPAGANVVFAVQPGPLVAYADRTKADPKALLAAAGVPADVTATLDRLGLPLDQIDHLAGGVTLTTTDLFPGFALVLKLWRPVADEEHFLRQLRAERKPKAGRPTYAVTAGLPLTMTKLDDRTYLFGLSDRDLSAADAPAGEPALPPGVKGGMARLSPASFAWVVTDDARWADTAVAKAFAAAAKDQPAKDRAAKLGLLRQAVAGVSLEPDLRLRVAVRTADADAATRLRAYFTEKLAAEKVAVGGETDWAETDVPLDPKGDVVRKLLADVR